MDRIDNILNHNLFLYGLHANEMAETHRRFCHHNMEHFLDVARIARIIKLEEGTDIDDELIYAAALLHDIGRYEQYERGVPHEEASAGLARVILPECGFDEKETDVILYAIEGHRGNSQKQFAKNDIDDTEQIGEAACLKNSPAMTGLANIIYRADKASRICWYCEARAECNWSDDKKNLKLRY